VQARASKGILEARLVLWMHEGQRMADRAAQESADATSGGDNE